MNIHVLKSFWFEVTALRNHTYQAGDLVVYTLPKQSPTPGPRARSIHPSRMGDDYSYLVDKFWMVAEVLPDNKLRLVTRRGKYRVVSCDDLLLHKAGWWQRFRNRGRFPAPELLQVPGAEARTA